MSNEFNSIPYTFIYVWESEVHGIRKSLSPGAWNGMLPTKTIPVWTKPVYDLTPNKIEPLACLTDFDEFGPIIDWYVDWTKLQKGVNLYSHPTLGYVNNLIGAANFLLKDVRRFQKMEGSIRFSVCASVLEAAIAEANSQVKKKGLK